MRSALPLLMLVSALASACGEEERRPTSTEATAGSSAGGANGAPGGSSGRSGGAGAENAGATHAGGAAGSGGATADSGSSGTSGGTAGSEAVGGGQAGTAPGSAGAAGSESEGTGGTNSSLNTGAVCTDDAECAVEDLCATPPGANVSTCRPRCSADDLGDAANCAEGEVCAFDSTYVRAACQELCSMGDAGLEGCEPPDGCRLEPEPELTGGEAVDGLCVHMGDASRGEACQAGGCSEGLECVAPFGSTGYCEPYCSPSAASGEPLACSDGETCLEGADGRWGCVRSCSPFAEDECLGGEACVPLSGLDDLSGRCVQEGERQRGEPCSPGECRAGLLCSTGPSPFASAELTCEPICDVEDSSVCGSGSCIQAPTENEGIGTCRTPCSLLGVGVAAGCTSDQWCAPAGEAPNVGVCVASEGQGSAGAECYPWSECGPGLYCECRFGADTGCAGEAYCEPICVPGAAPTDPGGCPEGQTCALESDQGSIYAFGTCRDVCDLSNASSCSDSSELCSASAVVGEASAVCLDVPGNGIEIGEPCTSPEHTIHEPCAAMGLCEFAPGTGSLVCTALCRASEGAIGSPNHPDCSDPSEVCLEIGPDLAYGYCGVPPSSE